MNRDAAIFVAGHRGLVGAALVRQLRAAGFDNLLLRERSELDLTCQQGVREFFAQTRPQYVFVAAARVGGIVANATRPAEFLWENLAIETNLVDSAWRNGTRKLLFLGSSCIYPRDAQAVLGLSAAVWVRRKLRHADESVWPWRQFQPAALACSPGADAQDSRGQGNRCYRGGDLGNRPAAA